MRARMQTMGARVSVISHRHKKRLQDHYNYERTTFPIAFNNLFLRAFILYRHSFTGLCFNHGNVTRLAVPVRRDFLADPTCFHCGTGAPRSQFWPHCSCSIHPTSCLLGAGGHDDRDQDGGEGVLNRTCAHTVFGGSHVSFGIVPALKSARLQCRILCS